jgi:alpha-galactosidase
MNAATKTILLNKEIIAIDQDPLGKQGYRVMRKDGLEVWKKELSGDRFALALFNRNSTSKTLTAAWKDIEMDSTKRFDAYDVWQHAAAGKGLTSISSNLQPHECNVFVLTESK